MIVRPRPTLFGLIFIMRGSILPTIWPRLLVVVMFSFAVAGLHRLSPGLWRDISAAPFTLLGLALSIFLGFRNNACYERWWEGRKQWGELLAQSRALARDIVTLLPDEAGLHRRCVHRIVAFAHALRSQLRGDHRSPGPSLGDDDAASAWLAAGEWAHIRTRRSRPDAILLALAADLATQLARGTLTDMLYRGFSDRLLAMTDIQTACERLRATPTPFTYSLLLHRTAWMFCLLLPVGVVTTLGLATPLLTGLLAYAFFGLDALGEELEEPFGRTQNALPLDAMVRGIEIAAGEALGDLHLPQSLAPKAFVLL